MSKIFFNYINNISIIFFNSNYLFIHLSLLPHAKNISLSVPLTCPKLWGLIMHVMLKCRFYVDDVPIRRYPRKSDDSFPLRPMWVYGSIWDASSWATENGKYKADYSYQPFVGKYNNFKIDGCTAGGAASCHPPSGSPSGSSGLSSQQYAALTYVQNNYKFYDYCQDPQRDHKLTPEC